MSKARTLLALTLVAGLTGAAAGLAYRRTQATPPETHTNALTPIEGDILAHLDQFQELAPEREAAQSELSGDLARELAIAPRISRTTPPNPITLPKPRPNNLPPAG